jgi:hypothetical protein
VSAAIPPIAWSSVMNRMSAALIVGVLALAGGCSDYQQGGDSSSPGGNASIDIEGGSRDALVGDTVTFVARSRDTYGRDAKITWNATAGDVTTDQEGRVARVKFTEPGTYSVRASLEIDGQPVQSDMVEVRVKPIN